MSIMNPELGSQRGMSKILTWALRFAIGKIIDNTFEEGVDNEYSVLDVEGKALKLSDF